MDGTQDWLNDGDEDRLAEARRRKRESILSRLPIAPPQLAVPAPAITVPAPAVVEAAAPPAAVPTVSHAPPIPATVKRPRDEAETQPFARPSKALPTSPLGEASGDDSDDEDMFAIGPSSSPRAEASSNAKPTRDTKDPAARQGQPASRAVAADSADDAEGYYPMTLGEALDGGRYVVEANLGKGMFSSVVRARDSLKGGTVAIKIVRSQESMYKAGLREAAVLERIQLADPQDKGHVVRLFRQFVHRGHLCLVFESLSMNLRQVVKRFGQGVGLHIGGVRSYAHQSLLALNLLSRAGVVHADLKPDNILVTESKAVLKVCDLGSAGDAPADLTTGLPGGERVMDIAPYLVSRFYRAPEIMLGSGPPGPEIDMWSLGCTLYELYTARILFPGRSNNHMLYLFQRLRGRFPTRMARRGQFARTHFDDMGNFLLRDAGTAKAIAFSRPEEDMRTRLGLAKRPAAGTAAGSVKADQGDDSTPPAPSTPEERVLVERLANLLDRMLELDPTKRITPKEALVHPFFAAQAPPAAA